MYVFKERLNLSEPAEAIEIILDTPIVNLEGHHDLKIRMINMLEDSFGCMYIRDLLVITKNQLAKVRGFGILETHRLKMCLVDIQKQINALDRYQRKQWKESQCKQFLSREEPVT